jgi:cytoskeleton protein RodZ
MTANSRDSTHDILAGCGQRLRQARESAGLSVDQVADRLHMPARVVRSLEAEDWSRLGAPVFVRGQVRSYSRLLGLMTAPMMAALDVGQVEPAQLVSRTHTPKAQWWAEQIGRRLVYIVLTVFLAVPAWIAANQHLSGDAGTAAPLDLPVSEGTGAVATPQPPRTIVASLAPVAAAAAPSEVVVRARAETWLEASARDGSSLGQGLLPAGGERRFAGAQLGRLTIGNASAVDVEHRGRRVDLAPYARANVVRFAVSSDGSLAPVD